jgi:hypothetical protein
MGQLTTDTIREAAQAAYRTYYGKRTWHQWETAGNATQIRWEQLAAQVLHGTFRNAIQCHAYYSDGLVDAVEWAGLKPGTRAKWRDVLETIRSTGQRREAA